MVDEVKSIIREQTPQEKEDYEDISRNKLTYEKVLRGKIAQEEQKANNPKIEFDKKLPYPGVSVLEDFHKAVRLAELSKVGYVGNKKLSDESKKKLEKEAFESISWKQYTEAKNFNLLEENEVVDDDLTKKNPGKTIYVKKKVYEFKDHSQRYVLMESKEEALRRAK